MPEFSRRALVIALGALATSLQAQDIGREQVLRFDRNAKAQVELLGATRAQVRPARSGGLLRMEWTLAEPGVVDVKRTDSLVDPVAGSVDLRVRLASTVPLATTEEAAQAKSEIMDEFRVQATYLPDGNGWSFKQGRFLSKKLGKWIDLKPEALRTEPASPMAELARLFEVR